MANKGITISIDAKLQLQNLDNERKRLADAFSKVDVGSKSYKELERELKAINKAYEDTAKLAGGAFHTQADVDKYVRSYEKLRGVMGDFDSSYAKLGRGDFTDKIFPDGFLDKLDKAGKDLEQAKKNYDDLGNKLFSQAVSGKKNLSSILNSEGVLDSASYEEMEQALSRALKSAAKSEEDYAKKVADSQKAIEEMTARLKELNEEKEKQMAIDAQLHSDVDAKQSEIATKEAEAAKKRADEEERINAAYENRLAPLQNLSKAFNAKTDKRQEIMPSVFTNGGGFKENKESIADFMVQQALAAGIQGVSKESVMAMSQDKIKELNNAIQDAIKAEKSKETSIIEQNYKAELDKLQPAKDELKELENRLKEDQKRLEQIQTSINKQQNLIDRKQKVADNQEKSRQDSKQKVEDVHAAEIELQNAQKESQDALEKSDIKKTYENAETSVKQLSDAQKQYITDAQNAGRTSDNLSETFGQMANQSNEAKRQIDQLDQVQAKLKNGVTNVVNRYLGFYAILNKVRAAVRTMINDIRELDKAITEIAIVTNFSQDDLWKQMPTYSAMAKEYGTSIKGVYEITQLYYQQGLNQADVMSLTTETLKMARIAGSSYADAADYMTTATRGFNMEMDEANRVVDVYAELAASSASSTTELATAMTKVAAQAQSVGSSFENTSAMLATVIEAVRESPETVGSSLRSIMARYGKMKVDPSALSDEEGAAMNFNDIDKALKSVGISMKDANNQFREFDDVIDELGAKWEKLDSTSQRYIATQFAGTNQQSRFLALMQNYDRYKELQDEAMNSEDAGTLQYLKTLDSVETKIQQLKTAFQDLYVNSGLQNFIKGLLDLATKLLTNLNKMPKLFNKIPTAALAVVSTIIVALKRGIMDVVSLAAARIEEVKNRINASIDENRRNAQVAVQGVNVNVNPNASGGANNRANGGGRDIAGRIISLAGLAASIFSMTTSSKGLSGGLQIGGALANGASSFFLTPGTPGMKAVAAIASALPGVVSGLSTLATGISREEKISNFKQNITNAHNDTLVSKNELKTLEDYKKKLEEAKAAQYDSVEAKQEYYDIMNEIADAYPEFFSYMDEEGNKVVELGKQYEELRRQKQEAYLSDLVEEGATNISALQDADYMAAMLYNDISGPNSYGYFDIDQYALGNELRAEMLELFRSNSDAVASGVIRAQGRQEWNYLLGESKTVNDTFDNLLLSLYGRSAVRDTEQNTLAASDSYKVIDAAQKGYSYGKMLQDSDLESAYTPLEEVYNAYLNFFKELNTNVKYVDKQLFTQIKQIVSAYNQSYDWGYGNSEQQFFSSEISRVIQEQVANIEDIDERAQKTEGLLNELRMMGDVDEWISKYDDTYVNLWEGVDEATKKSIDELAAKSNDTSAAVFETKLQKLLGDGHEELIRNLMQGYADTVDWTKEDFINALGEYSSQKGKGDINVRPFENLTPAMQQSLIASLKSADEDGNRGLVGATENLYSFLNNLNEAQIGIASEIIKTADFTTISGLRKFQQEMAKNNIDVSAQVEQIKANTHFNLVTEIGDYVSTVSEQLEDYEKFFSSAEKGMDFKDANAAAQKMGLDITKDFTFDNGAYYLNNFDKVRESYAKYYQDLTDAYAKEVRRMEDNFTSLIQNGGSQEDINAAYDKWVESQAAYNKAQEMAQNAVDYLFNTFLLSTGKFSDFVSSLGFDSSVAQLIQNGDVEGVKVALGSQWSKYGSAIVEAISNAPYDLMSNLIKGVESGEIFTLTQEQYQSIAGDANLQKAFNVVVDSTNGEVSLQMVNLAEAWKYIQELLDKGTIKNVKQYNEVAKQIANYEAVRNTPVATLLDSFENLYHITDAELIDYADKLGVSTESFIYAWNNSTKTDPVQRILDAASQVGVSVEQTEEDARAVLLKMDDIFSDVSDMIQKGTQGTTLSEAVAIAEKLGGTVEELFRFRGTDLVFKDDYNYGELYEIYIQKLKSLGYDISEEFVQQYAASLTVDTLVENGQYIDALSGLQIAGIDITSKVKPAYEKALQDVYSSIGENIINGGLIYAENSTRQILEWLDIYGIVEETAEGSDVYKIVKGEEENFLKSLAGATEIGVEEQMSIFEDAVNNLSTEMYSGDLLSMLNRTAKTATDKMKDKISEMMQNLLNNITSAVANGISGSASASDISNLETQFGLSINTDRTADGYKIQQNSLYEIYGTLKNIDTIAAHTVLTALAESAQTSDERLNDVFYVMERIKEINDELAQPNISDARRKKLQAELDIAEELQKQLKEADSTFDFMSRDLASGYDDPLSAWKGMGTAGEVLNGDDYAKGLVGFQDFSNMISFMGDDVLREAGILNDKSQTASDLILAASGALKNVGGETFVDLSALGVNFNTGSEAMKEGLMKAVQNLAKSQIEIIDAEIKVLETVVNSQEAFEKLKGDKIELTVEDLIPIALGESDQEWNVTLSPLTVLLKDYLFSTGRTIQQIIDNPSEFLNLTPNEQALITSILNSLNGEDWDNVSLEIKQQIVDKLNTAFKNSGINQKAELVMGESGYVVTFADTTKEAMDDAASATSELDENISALQDTAQANNPFQPWETTLANCEDSIARIDNYISNNGSFGGSGSQSGGSGGTNNRSNQKSSRFSAVAYDDGGVSATTVSLQNAQTTIVDSLDAAIAKLTELAQVVANIPDKSTEINKLVGAINHLRSKTLSLSATISLDIETTGANVNKIKTNVRSGASKTGIENIRNKVAAAKGTLMGELGPEMVVSNGRYFMVGQNGAEFVNLDKDAIVFNHLQTRQLMSTGLTSRGTAYTNEKNATAYAKGNTTGPAMASAADALAELRKIRAQWQQLLDSPASSLGAKAGSGGGSGGGGGGKDATAQIHDLERWYNLLRQIEKYEQKITYEQQKRENLQNGYNYVDSLEKELEYLKKQQKAYSDLASLQKSYYDARRKDLLSTDYSMIFRYDEDGLMQYVDGANKGLDILAKLNETDANGAPINNAKDSSAQLAYLKSIGFDVAHLSTNTDGSSAEDDDQRMQNFWDNVDGWMEELDGLYDEYNEHLTSVEENTAKQNEILQEYIDNQLSIEEKLLTAVEDRQQAIIDSLQDQKDALEESSQAYIDGLSDALSKERNMYDKQSTADETAKLRRQLSILQRAGGSAAEIKSLQDQIDGRMKDEYFDKMQEQIDAVQEASDKQLEKLQNQIDLLTESLEYQKENGLLWQEVYDMMNSWTPEKMLQFIEEFTKTYKENSNLQNSEDSKDTFKELQIWDAKRTSDQRNSDWNDYYSKLDKRFDSVKEDNVGLAQDAFARGYGEGGRTAAEAAANAVFEEALKNASNRLKPDGAGNDGSSGGNVEDTTAKGDATFKNKNYKVYSYDDATTDKKGFVVYGNGKNVSFKVHDEQGGRILISGTDGKGQKIDKRWVPKRYFQYANGGLVDYTGPAWVDGTKTKPEAFLSAEDTQLLKSKIFSNSAYSLRSTLEAIENLGKTFANISAGASSGQSINIEKLEVAIQPGVISSDYDAKRAGEMALEEMVRIARKTTNRVVSR